MKKVVLSIAILAFVSLSMHTYAQSPTDNLFDKYGAKDGFTTVHITKELFSLFAEVAQESDDPETKEMQEVIQGLNYIRILMYEVTEDGKTNQKTLDDFRNQLNTVKLNNFTELMTVKESDETVQFMITKNGKIITELLLLINQNNQAGFISITGNIDLKSIAKLSKTMNIKGLENLEKIHNHDGDKK